MRIGFFVWEYPPRLVGGLGSYAQNIVRKYVELGHDIVVFTLNPGDLKTREVVQGVEVHRPLLADASNIFPLFVTEDLKRWGGNMKFFSDIFLYNILSATKLLNDLVKKEDYNFDIVCVHDWLSSTAGLIIKNEAKLPVVFHVHSTEWGRSWGGGSEVVSHFESTSAQQADHIVTVSYAMKQDLARHGWPENKISVVWNGVDSEKYNLSKVPRMKIQDLRTSYGIGDSANMILFIGRLTWVKAVRNLIQAIPVVLKDFPDTKVVILGSGEEERDVKELASRLRITDKIAYKFEFVPEEERIIHYASSDVCVFPSTYEPFGIVSLEAMSLERPVVVGANGVVGFREQVLPSGPDRNGVHVNGSDPADIGWGIMEVLKDLERAKQWGKNGRKRVLEYFTWDTATRQTLQVYERLIHK